MLRVIFFFLGLGMLTLACQQEKEIVDIRQPVDSVGFATEAWQMDSIMERLKPLQSAQAESAHWKLAICPHDDYAYAGSVYQHVLPGVKARTLILFGVAHKAADLGLKDKLIFDDFDAWQAPYGPVEISPLRKSILEYLPDTSYQIHRKMHRVEHSLEALLPFLQYYHSKPVEIIPVLVPHMRYQDMEAIAPALARAVMKATEKTGMEWGKDLAMVISTDAVHYGNERWGGKDYARYGTDSAGYRKAVAHEHRIIDRSFKGELRPEKASAFYHATVSESDYTQYQWTWCGRYSVPLGMLTAWHLNRLISPDAPLQGHFLDYATSIDHPPLQVEDLGMGHTAPANAAHWVGYAAAGYQ
jgi:AmmeMemoRadiSam system protein B